MSSQNLQSNLDQLSSGDVLKLEPARGEFKGPLVINKPAVIDGQGGTIWATTGPVLQIDSPGVELRDLFVEITSRDASLTGESVCALKIRPGLNVAMRAVAVRGTVLGVDPDEGAWQ